MANVDLLLARVRRTFGEASPEQAVERVRAIIGTERLPENAEGGLAREALQALKNGEEPTPKQLAALEMMMRMMRPAPKIVNGRPEDFAEEDFLKLFPAWEKFQEAVQPFVRSIGRIDRTDGQPLGTGFLVNETTLVTNRHVLDGASNGTRQLERGQAIVSFRREFQTPDESPVDIVGVKGFASGGAAGVLGGPSAALCVLRPQGRRQRGRDRIPVQRPPTQSHVHRHRVRQSLRCEAGRAG
jgi:S1-C subfamily serine protease